MTFDCSLRRCDGGDGVGDYLQGRVPFGKTPTYESASKPPIWSVDVRVRRWSEGRGLGLLGVPVRPEGIVLPPGD